MIKKLMIFIWKYISPINCARYIGVKIGDNCRMYGSTNWGSEPYRISIGNHVLISFGVTFITHDAATWVFREKEKYKGVAKFGNIQVGNNVFIGARSMILPNVELGDDAIIAAGAVVTNSVPPGNGLGGGTGSLHIDNQRLCCEMF